MRLPRPQRSVFGSQMDKKMDRGTSHSVKGRSREGDLLSVVVLVSSQWELCQQNWVKKERNLFPMEEWKKSLPYDCVH